MEVSKIEQGEVLSKVKILGEDNKNALIKVSEINEKIRTSNQNLAEKVEKTEKNLLKLQNDFLVFNEIEKNIERNCIFTYNDVYVIS